MFLRIVAALWIGTTLRSLTLGIRLVAKGSGPSAGTELSSFGQATSQLGKWQLRVSLIAVAAAMQSFMSGTLNTSLWPLSSLAWVALLSQLLFLRPHLVGYLEIVERGFQRPVRPFGLAHALLDLVTVSILIALLTTGVT